VANSKGTATIAMFTAPEFVDEVRRREGAVSIFTQCPGCVVKVDQSFVASTAGTDMGPLTKAILQANPEVDTIWTGIGGYGALQVQAVDEMGLKDKIKLGSNDCNPQDLTNIRKGNVQVACVASLNEESGWGAVDELNRAFNGAQPGGDLIPIRLFDSTNLPPTDRWTGDYDYPSTYKKLWGIAN
jgi:ribose transport system substrate-binding protein